MDILDKDETDGRMSFCQMIQNWKFFLLKMFTLGERKEKYINQRSCTISTVKHGGGNIMLRECFSISGTWELVKLKE